MKGDSLLVFAIKYSSLLFDGFAFASTRALRFIVIFSIDEPLVDQSLIQLSGYLKIACCDQVTRLGAEPRPVMTKLTQHFLEPGCSRHLCGGGAESEHYSWISMLCGVMKVAQYHDEIKQECEKLRVQSGHDLRTAHHNRLLQTRSDTCSS